MRDTSAFASDGNANMSSLTVAERLRKARVVIRLIGEVQLVVGGREHKFGPSTADRLILALLLLRYRVEGVERPDLRDLLWLHDSGSQKARGNRLSQRIERLKRSLGAFLPNPKSRDPLRLQVDDYFWIDAYEIERCALSGSQTERSWALRYCEEHGPLLQEVDPHTLPGETAQWLLAERRRLDELLEVLHEQWSGSNRHFSPRAQRGRVKGQSAPRLAIEDVELSAVCAPLTLQEGIARLAAGLNAEGTAPYESMDLGSAIAAICNEVGCNPTYIDLLASAGRGIPPERLLQELEVQPVMCTYNHHPAGMHRALSWCIQRLPIEARHGLQAATIFYGDWDLPAFAAVVKVGVMAASALLTELTKASFVQVVPQEWDLPDRFRISPDLDNLLRETSLGETAIDAEFLHQRHGEYFAHWGYELAGELSGAGQVRALRYLEREEANLNAALDWLHERDPERAIRLASRLWRYWNIKGLRAEGFERLQSLLAQTDKCEHDCHFAHALQGMGTLAFRLGRMDARNTLEQAAQLYQQLAIPSDQAKLLRQFGRCEADLGNFSYAHELYLEALRLSHGIDDLEGLAHAHNGIGYLLAEQGRLLECERHWNPALSIWRRLGNLQEIAAALNCLGQAAWVANENDKANRLWRESLDLYTSLGDRSGVGFVLANQGGWALDQRSFDEARIKLQQSLIIRRQLGEMKQLAATLLLLANTEIAAREHLLASLYLREALPILQKLSDACGLVEWIEAVARVLVLKGEPHQAARLIGCSKAQREDISALPPLVPKFNRKSLEAISRSVRRKLGVVPFDAALSTGRNHSLSQAIQSALRRL